jgi:hypothetical protein
VNVSARELVEIALFFSVKLKSEILSESVSHCFKSTEGLSVRNA